MRLKVGIIGLGAVSDAHLEAYSDIPGIGVVAAAEPRSDRLNKLSVLHNFRPYPTHKEMLAQAALDIACVLVPVNLHCEITEACAKAGVHVFCEKPLASSLQDAERMVSVCETHGVKLFYGASYRFFPAVQKARELISSGAIGNVLLMIETILGGSGPTGHRPMSFAHYPKGGPGGSGMGMVDHGVHLIDLFPWLTNSEIVSVFGRGNISGEVPATEYAHITLSNGAVGQLLYNDGTFDTDLPTEGIFSGGAAWSIDGYEPDNSWHAHPGCIRIYGDKGSMRIFHYANQLYFNSKSGIRQIPLINQPPPAHFRMQMESFAQSIINDEQPEVGGKDGVQALRVLLAIYKSAASKETILIQK